MNFDLPMRLTGPLDSSSLMNQLGMPGGYGMRVMGPYDTASLMRSYGPQNAIGYGAMGAMGGMGMGGMGMGMMGNPMAGMGMAATAVAAAAMLHDEQQQQQRQNNQQWNSQPGMNQQQNQQWGNQSGMNQPQNQQWGNQSGMNQPQNQQWGNQSGMGQQQNQQWGNQSGSSTLSTPTPMNQQLNPNAPQNQSLGGMPTLGSQPQAWNAPNASNPNQPQAWNAPNASGQQQNQPWNNQSGMNQQQQNQQWGNQSGMNQQQQNQPWNNQSGMNQQQQNQPWNNQPGMNQQQQNQQRSAPPVQQQPAAPKTTAPSLPSGGQELRRGQKFSLGANLRKLKIGLRWDVRDARCDLDASAFLLTGNEKVPADEWFVFYGQEQSPDYSTKYQGYDVGGADMMIDLTKVRQDIEKIALAVTIYEAIAQRLNFSMVNSVRATMINAETNQVLASVDLTDCSAVVTALVVGEVYRYKGEWKFNAVGSGVSRDLAGFCAMYGVNLE